MAVVIQADPSVAGLNCFCTVAEADVLMEYRLHNTDWTGATTATKTASLLWSSKLLNTLNWVGVRTSGTQPMSFPRRGLSMYETSDVAHGFDHERVDLDGMGYFTKIEISDTTIPAFLKEATVELAMWLINSDTTAPTGLEGLKRLKVENIELESLPKDRQNWFNDAVRDLVWRYLKNSSKYSAPVTRVG